ncbi:MAG: LVIVD repeat-containing protein, partial [Actinomycetes bacterium]
GTPGTARNVEQVGHEPLNGRGMNAALTFYGDHAYVGNRTDGSAGHPSPGVQVVDVSDPTDPTVAGEFGTELASGANAGQTSRELRVWPAQGLLMIMYFRCSSVIHACPPSADTFRIRFFDLKADPVNPPVVATYTPTRKPHEMYLWVDPQNPDRALLWISTPTSSADPDRANLLITDISRAREGVFTEVAKGNWNQLYPGSSVPANYDNDLALHSMAPTADGKRTYLAYLRGHFLVLDTSEVADGVAPGETVNLNDKLLTPVENRPRWGTADGGCVDSCAESHSAVPLPGRPFALTTDEVYGTFTAPSHGCPWGWSRLINTAQPKHPRILAEYKLPENEQSFCLSSGNDPATDQFTSYASHNPTLTRKLALISWHSGGLQVVDTSDPGAPTQAGWFSPQPLSSVATEDPALSRGPNKVVMWSYPVVRDGLIYVVDIRNGLYVLRYTGPHAKEVGQVAFLEGNSNLGDAVRLAGAR